MNIQVFCLPYAGGEASCFVQLQEKLEADMEIYSVEYSGHGSRLGEKLYSDWDSFLDDVAVQIQENYRGGSRICLLGYSMGSIVAHELIRRKLLPVMPTHLVLISHSAPNVSWASVEWTGGDDVQMVDRMKNMGGFKRVTDKIVSSRYFQYRYLEPLRADYRLLQNYKSIACGQTLLDTTVFFSANDETIINIEKWKDFYFPVSFYQTGENHFVLDTSSMEIADKIREMI